MVLRDILEDDMYLHFLLLSSAITLLLGLSVTEDDVTLAEEMIYIYLTMYPALYGKPNFTHSLREASGDTNRKNKTKQKNRSGKRVIAEESQKEWKYMSSSRMSLRTMGPQ